MNSIDVNSVLAQIRSYGTQAAAKPLAAPLSEGTAAAGKKDIGGFQDFLSNAVQRVNNTQGQAEQLRRAFELGDPAADLSRVMLAGARAQVEFKGMVEVRNRLVSAYQDIMNMPV